MSYGSSKVSSSGSSSFLSGSGSSGRSGEGGGSSSMSSMSSSSCVLPSMVTVNWVRLSFPLGVPTAYSGTATLVTTGIFAGLVYSWTGSGMIISLFWNGNRWEAYSGGNEVLAISGPDYCDPRGAYTPVAADVLSLGVF
jgi:hypothetical protein